MTDNRQDRYLDLIDRLLRCPAGQEPDILDAQPDLLDEGFIQVLVRVATILAHEDNPDGAKCLIHVARELAQQLGLYPQLSS